jgi:hypothetical protein
LSVTIFQRQFVVIAQEDRPLAIRRDFRRLAQDVADRKTVLLGDCHNPNGGTEPIEAKKRHTRFLEGIGE